MNGVLWTAAAQADLREIHGYVAADSPFRADELIRRVERTARLIHSSPSIGKRCSHLAEDLHAFPLDRYILFYLIVDAQIVMVRVLHGARDIEHLFGD